MGELLGVFDQNRPAEVIELGLDLLPGLEEVAVLQDGDGGLAVVGDVGHLGRGQGGVDRHPGGTEVDGGQVGHHVLGTVGGLDGGEAVLLQAQGLEAGGQLQDPGPVLRPGQAAPALTVPEVDGGTVSEAGGVVGEDVDDGAAGDGGVDLPRLPLRQ